MSYNMVALLARTLYNVGMAGLGVVEIAEMVEVWESSKCGRDNGNGVLRDCRVVALFQLLQSVSIAVSEYSNLLWHVSHCVIADTNIDEYF